MVEEKKLKLFTAFLRESSEKVYILDRIREQKLKVRMWIDVKKPSVYISGKAVVIAREVRRAIVDVLLKLELEPNTAQRDTSA